MITRRKYKSICESELFELFIDYVSPAGDVLVGSPICQLFFCPVLKHVYYVCKHTLKIITEIITEINL